MRVLFTSRRSPDKMRGFVDMISRLSGQEVDFHLKGSEIVVTTSGDPDKVYAAIKELE